MIHRQDDQVELALAGEAARKFIDEWMSILFPANGEQDNPKRIGLILAAQALVQQWYINGGERVLQDSSLVAGIQALRLGEYVCEQQNKNVKESQKIVMKG